MTIRDKIAELLARKGQLAPGVASVQKGYQLDPRTALSNSMLAAGADTSPVAQGKYAWADGLARAIQGGVGGYMARKNLDAYYDRGQQAADAEAANATTQLAKYAPPAPVTQAPLAPLSQNPNRALADKAAQVLGGAPAPTPQAGNAPPVAPALAGGPPRVTPPAQPPVAPPAPAQGVVFNRPLAQTGRVTSEYGVARPGHKHNGIDIAAPEGTPIDAAAGGVVERVFDDKVYGGGLTAYIRHPDGTSTRYAHAQGYDVKPGDEVQQGQVIGRVGKTGNATGPVLHFVVRDRDGKPIDPNSVFGRRAPEVAQSAADAAVPPASASPAQADKYGVAIEQLPTRPEAVAATETPRLRRAYEMLARGDQYQYDAAQAELSKALGEQADLNEAAAAREQKIRDAEYDAGLNRYGTQQDRMRSQGFTGEQNAAQRGLTASEGAANRENALEIARLNADNRAAVAAASIAAKGMRPIPGAIGEKLTKYAGEYDSVNNLAESFKAGYLGKWAGNKDVAINRIIGNDPEMAAWWDQYKQLIAAYRKNLFGSAFTAQEKAEFDQFVITPRMSAAVAKDHMDRQQAVTGRYLARLSRGIGKGYGQEQVEEYIGRPLAELPSSAPPSVASAPAAAAAASGGWGKATRVD